MIFSDAVLLPRCHIVLLFWSPVFSGVQHHTAAVNQSPVLLTVSLQLLVYLLMLLCHYVSTSLSATAGLQSVELMFGADVPHCVCDLETGLHFGPEASLHLNLISVPSSSQVGAPSSPPESCALVTFRRRLWLNKLDQNHNLPLTLTKFCSTQP